MTIPFFLSFCMGMAKKGMVYVTPMPFWLWLILAFWKCCPLWLIFTSQHPINISKLGGKPNPKMYRSYTRPVFANPTQNRKRCLVCTFLFIMISSQLVIAQSNYGDCISLSVYFCLGMYACVYICRDWVVCSECSGSYKI